MFSSSSCGNVYLEKVTVSYKPLLNRVSWRKPTSRKRQISQPTSLTHVPLNYFHILNLIEL
jgi:hypothetical protein